MMNYRTILLTTMTFIIWIHSVQSELEIIKETIPCQPTMFSLVISYSVQESFADQDTRLQDRQGFLIGSEMPEVLR